MKMSATTTTVMAFRGAELIRTNVIVVNDQSVGQVNHFSCLRNDISYDENYDTDCKLHKFQKICVTNNPVLSNTLGEFYKTEVL